jgi:diaminohydroxyphosphoribosylaminopyrimidine deaminase / 5-amino-6-(5-phosphoribosylamino)uracil reductase
MSFMVSAEQDIVYLSQAFELAKQGLGQCAKNPAVGAVIIKNGVCVGAGFHRGVGQAHAEVEACLSLPADFDYQNATLYVTLEPCCHTGRTPPCTDLIIEKKFSRVVFGFFDPNPLVSGQGQRLISKAGIICDYLPSDEAQKFYHAYAYWWQHKKPFVIAKLAQSANDKVAGEKGEPLVITGETAREFTHLGRLASDVIVSSARTVIKDDPAFNIRLPDMDVSRNLFILDKNLKITPPRKIFSTAKSLTFIHDENIVPTQFEDLYSDVQYQALPLNHEGHFDPRRVLDYLAIQGYHQVWLEAGPKLLRAWLNAGIINRFYLYQSSKIYPESYLSGISAVELLALAKIPGKWEALGEDKLLSLEL